MITRPATLLLPFCLSLLLASPAWAQNSLLSYLSPEAQQEVTRLRAQPRVQKALSRLQQSKLSRPALEGLLQSSKAAPYLADGLPQLADLTGVTGIHDVVNRMTRGGQSGAYELAVAHAFRKQITAASAVHKGNEVDGLLRSGTVIECKSGRPKRPDHVLEQVRRRAKGGVSVVLALNYVPPTSDLTKLSKLSKALGGRLQVTYLPLRGDGFHVLVAGKQLIQPSGRKLMKSLPGVKVPTNNNQPGSTSAVNKARLSGRKPLNTTSGEVGAAVGSRARSSKVRPKVRARSQSKVRKVRGRVRVRTGRTIPRARP